MQQQCCNNAVRLTAGLTAATAMIPLDCRDDKVSAQLPVAVPACQARLDCCQQLGKQAAAAAQLVAASGHQAEISTADSAGHGDHNACHH
jgi:hypothetical protein